MRVRLLGPVSAEVGGTVVDLGGTKQRAVFALLAMSPGRVVSMDRLIDDLWHDEPPARATVTLRAYVSRLRRALDVASTASGAPRADVPEIRTQPPGWVLTLPPASVDLVVFHQLLEQARVLLPEDGDVPPAQLREGSSLLVRALELWHGDVLADLRSLEVARTRGARAEDARLSAVELLMETRLRLGEHERVVDEARTFVTQHPFRERAWAALVLALYRSGRQADALAAVTELRGLLVEEFGMDPTPRVQSLERQVLQQDASLLPPDARAAGGMSLAEEPGAVPAYPVSTSVVGRTDTLRVFGEVIAAAQRGVGRLLILEGESGAGKTTMLDALGERVTGSGGRVIRGGGGGAGAMPALWSWVTVVRALEQDRPPTQRSGSGATALTLMGSSTSVGSGVGSGAPEVPVATLSRTALFRGVVELLAAAHQQARLTVVFDDLQWADEETITLLSLAVDELAPRGVVFAVGVRTDEPDSPRVLDTLARAPRSVLLRHRLDGLDEKGVAELTRSVSGRTPPDQLAAALHLATAGNPLFVTEIVRLLAAERRLDVGAITSTLPDRVHDVLRQRLDRLPAPSVALVQIAAVARAPVDIDLLAAVVGEDPDQVLDDVESALISGLLVERPDRYGLVPSHDLVRQAVLLGLSAARRVRLHARLAAALQAREHLGPEEVVEVAHHLVAAAPAVGPAAAIPFLVAAAEDAISRYATITGARILEEALAAALQIEDPAARAEAEHRVRGQLAMVRGYVGADAALPPARTDPPLPLDSTSIPAWVGTVIMGAARGDVTGAREIARRALNRSLPSRGEIVAQHAVGTTSFDLGEYATSTTALERVIALTESDPTGGGTGIFSSSREVAFGYLALIAHDTGDDATASLIFEQSLAQARTNKVGTILLELYLGMYDCMRGDPAAARQSVDRLRAMAVELEYPVFGLQGRIMGAWATAMTVAVADAAPITTAVERYRATGLLVFEPTYDALLAEVCQRAGDQVGAAAAVSRARSICRTTGQVVHGPRLRALVDELERALV